MKPKPTIAEIGIKILSQPPPFICDDCKKNPAWFDPRFYKAICDKCWETGNYGERIRMSIDAEKAQRGLE